MLSYRPPHPSQLLLALLLQVTLTVSWIGVLYEQLTQVEKSEFESQLGGCVHSENGLSFTTPPLLEPWKMIRNIDLPTGKVYLFIYQYFVWEKYPNLRKYKGIWAMWMAVLAGQGPGSRNIWILRLRKSRQEVYGVSLGVDTSETFTTPCIFPQENLNSEEVWFNNKVGRITLLVVFG